LPFANRNEDLFSILEQRKSRISAESFKKN